MHIEAAIFSEIQCYSSNKVIKFTADALVNTLDRANKPDANRDGLVGLIRPLTINNYKLF